MSTDPKQDLEGFVMRWLYQGTQGHLAAPPPREAVANLLVDARNAIEAMQAAGWVSPEEHRVVVERADDLNAEIADCRMAEYASAIARVEAVRAKWDERGAGTLNDWQWCRQMLDDLTAALAEPKRDHVAEAAAIRKQVEG
jgi:hypothetical protein